MQEKTDSYMTWTNPKIKLTVKVIMFFLSQLFFFESSLAQEKKEISLQEAIRMATQSSLDALKAKAGYSSSYWEFRSYKAGRLPDLVFRASPLEYSRQVTQRYDSETNRDVYRPQETLNSFFSLSLNQDLPFTGGSIYLNSSFNQLLNFQEVNSRDTTIRDYSTTPFRIGLEQPIMAFNQLKWDQLIAPLAYDKSEKDYILQLQIINQNVVELFFNLAQAQVNGEVARQNLISNEELFEIAQNRYRLGSIEKQDLLNMELAYRNAKVSHIKSKRALTTSLFEFGTFIRSSMDSLVTLIMPDVIDQLMLDREDALVRATQAHPNAIDYRIRLLEAEQYLDQTIKEARLDMSLSASYGINTQANETSQIFNDYLDQQLVALNLSIPLFDWGERKGKVKMAKLNMEVAEIEIAQEQLTFEQEIYEKVLDFNMQRSVVENAIRSEEIAKESYELTKKRFKSGQADVLSLNNAREAYQVSVEEYINSLRSYWGYYYEIQALTFYDYMNQKPLNVDFEEILK